MIARLRRLLAALHALRLLLVGPIPLPPAPARDDDGLTVDLTYP